MLFLAGKPDADNVLKGTPGLQREVQPREATVHREYGAARLGADHETSRVVWQRQLTSQLPLSDEIPHPHNVVAEAGDRDRLRARQHHARHCAYRAGVPGQDLDGVCPHWVHRVIHCARGAALLVTVAAAHRLRATASRSGRWWSQRCVTAQVSTACHGVRMAE